MEEKKAKILLCEDDQNLGLVLKNYLELNDFDVVLERDGRLDALIEYGVNACFHIFIYHDGNPPRSYYFAPRKYETIPLFAGLIDDDPDLD